MPQTLLIENEHKLFVEIPQAPALLRIDSFTTESDSSLNVIGETHFLSETFSDIIYQIPFNSTYHMNTIKLIIKISFCADGVSDKVECFSKPRKPFLEETITLPIIKYNFLLFAETSKPIYKPQELIQFRLFAIYPTNLKINAPPGKKVCTENCHEVISGFEEIYLEDPFQIRIKQWNNVNWTDALNLTYQLTKEPVLGMWKLVGKHRENTKQISFEVKKYVLPKFMMELKSTREIDITDTTISFSVCARYTNGLPVRGIVSAKFCVHSRYFWHNDPSICRHFHGLLHGKEPSCFKFNFPSFEFNLSESYYTKIVNISASVEEEGTGILIEKMSEERLVQRERNSNKILLDIPESYKPGMYVDAKITTLRNNGSILPFQKVKVKISVYLMHSIEYHTTNEKGETKFKVNTTGFYENANILVTHANNSEEFAPVSQLLKRWRSIYDYFLKASHNERSNLNLKDNDTCPSSISLRLESTLPISNQTIYAQVMARGQLISMERFLSEKTNDQMQSNFYTRNIDIKLESTAFPGGHLVLYFIAEGKIGQEIIADYLSIEEKDVPSCFLQSKKARFSFDKKEVVPGSQLNILFNSNEKSAETICGLSISDESLKAFGNSGRLDIETIIKELIAIQNKIDQTQFTWNHPYNDIKRKECSYKGFNSRYYGTGYDSANVFARNGIFPLTNMHFLLEDCISDEFYHYGNSVMVNYIRRGEKLIQPPHETLLSSANALEVRIRSFFPETWKFDVVKNPPKQQTVTIPDSITKWILNAFCFEDQSLASISSDYVTVSMPFYIIVNVPYSVKRGEIVDMPVKVFNNLLYCFEVTLTLMLPPDIEPPTNNIISSCLCETQATFFFSLNATKLGSKEVLVTAKSSNANQCHNNVTNNLSQKTFENVQDAVKVILKVEPEGVPEELNLGDIVCFREKELTIKHSLETSTPMVEGSQRLHVTFGGDIMGPSLINLDRLIRMPHGCGEQNMITMVPSIYILDYLTSINVENEDIISKAKEYISTGYKRQLKYKHKDGSYSAFGEDKDQEGSTWLTAFVLKSFQEASHYISDISDTDLNMAFNFLSQRQLNDSGCFEEKGKLFRDLIKGGAADIGSSSVNPLLTAYILTALTETNRSYSNESKIIIDEGITCINNYIDNKDLQNIRLYSLSLITYALSIHQPDSPLTTELQDVLLSRSTKEISWEYWTNIQKSTISKRSWSSGFAADVETSAYAYLALEKKRSRADSLKTIRWLATQRNSIGGFHSTQDSVMALKAMSNFAKSLNITDKMDLQIRVNSGNDTVRESITNINRMVTHKVDISMDTSKEAPKVTWTLSGTGCVNIQSSFHFTLARPYTLDVPFTLDVTVTEEPLAITVYKRANMSICFSYTDASTDSNMLLLTIELISGWRVADDTLETLLLSHSDSKLKRFETNRGALNLYYESISKDDNADRCIDLSMERDILVMNTKEVTVTLLDYYNPEVSIARMYGLSANSD